MTGKPHIEKAVAWLREQGAEHVRVEHDSKHPKIFYTWRGTERFYVTSWTPRNEEACGRLSIRDLRHEMGLVGGKRVGKRRRHRDRAPAAPTELPSLTPGPAWAGRAHHASRAPRRFGRAPRCGMARLLARLLPRRRLREPPLIAALFHRLSRSRSSAQAERIIVTMMVREQADFSSLNSAAVFRNAPARPPFPTRGD